MKINHLVQGSEYKKQNTQPSFKGTADAGLRYLATNLGIGANMTDIGFMVFPRVLSDAQRGPAACIETTRREASGTLNHSSIGLYGWLAGAGIATMMGLKEKFGVNANAMFTAPETLNILAENKVNQIKNNPLTLMLFQISPNRKNHRFELPYVIFLAISLNKRKGILIA